MPSTVIARTTAVREIKTTFASSQNSSLERFILYSLKTGTKAEFVAPSPTKSLNKFGILKAITNACA